MFGTNLTFGKKIIGGTSLLLALILVISGLGLYGLNRSNQQFDTSARRTVRTLALASKASLAESNMVLGQRGYILYTLTQLPQEAAEGQALFGQAVQEVRTVLKEIEPLLVNAEGHRLVSEAQLELGEWERVFPEIVSLVQAQKGAEAAQVAIRKSAPLHQSIQARLSRLAELQQQQLRADEASLDDLETSLTGLNAILMLLGALAGGLALWVAWDSTRQLRQISTELNQGAQQVASASAQVSSVSQSLAQGASEQAASLEETSASTEELNAMTKQSAEGARKAAEETHAADTYLQETNGRLKQMIESMHDINASSEKISKIIRVIDEIAFQTNILALNAAVEAARAGDAGLGFAVVADEVRSLAQRCAQAAKDTSELIEESVARSQEGRTRLDEVTVSISKVLANASQIRQLVDEVKHGSSEQAHGIEQIARTVVEMQRVTQSTAASAEEGASAGEQMSAQAESLRHSARQLQLLVG